MLTRSFVIALLAGPLLALPYSLHALRSDRPYPTFAIGLVAAALIYVVLAAAALERTAVLVELGGMFLFGVLVILGLKRSPYWLVAGWLAHVAWDVALHPVERSSYAPWWYPVLCIGFDILVAGFLLAIVVRPPVSKGREAR